MDRGNTIADYRDKVKPETERKPMSRKRKKNKVECPWCGTVRSRKQIEGLYCDSYCKLRMDEYVRYDLYPNPIRSKYPYKG